MFSFGRANIKGKLGKRLTQNLESHHSSDFLFTMRGGGRGIGGIGETMAAWAQAGTDWDRLARLGMTGTEEEQEQQQERVLARVSRAHAGAGAGRRQGPDGRPPGPEDR